MSALIANVIIINLSILKKIMQKMEEKHMESLYCSMNINTERK